MASPLLKRKPPETSPVDVPEVEELFRFLRLARTTPESLAENRRVLESIPEVTAQKVIALGMQVLRTHIELPSVLNNLKHVEDQLLRPVIQDAEDLSTIFGIDPTRFRLLVILHDLGKAEIPAKLKKALDAIFPKDYVAREILTHEFASMGHIENLAKEAGLSLEQVTSLQQLIANHNFGPDLCHDRHKSLRDNWWPSKFREKLVPAFQRLGFDLDSVYHRSPDGEYQYPHAEDDAYAALLAAYDRAIANKFNAYGVLTWQKFAQQDYLSWEKTPVNDRITPSPFNCEDLTVNMRQAAIWAETEIRAMWKVLAERHVVASQRKSFKLAEFPPFQRQLEGVQRLLASIERVRQSNATELRGVMKYVTKTGEAWRVEDRPPTNTFEKAKLKIWDPNTEEWCLVAEDNSPIKLYFEIVRADL